MDLEAIAKKCNLFNGANDANADDVISKISNLDTVYESDELVEIYNYFLTICKSPEILMAIIRKSDKYRYKSSLSPLLDILLWKIDDNNIEKEKYVNVRVMCAKAIANLKETSSVTALLYCLNNKDENYKVRFACADALGKIGDRYAVAPLIDVVKDEDERSVYLRESAASALGMLGDFRAIEPLVSILETKQGIMDKFTFLKERVIEALGKLKVDNNRRVFNVLKSSLRDESPQIRINAIEALMESDYDEAYDAIKSCLADSDDEVKKNALIALYNMVGRRILDEVIKETSYGDILKVEAVSMLEEYETDEEDEMAQRIRRELDE